MLLQLVDLPVLRLHWKNSVNSGNLERNKCLFRPMGLTEVTSTKV